MPFVAVAVVLALAGLALTYKLAPGQSEKSAKQTKVAECQALIAQRDSLRVQGGDTTAIARIDAQITTCITQANALGAKIDPALAGLQTCDSYRAQVEAEWTHYKSTDYGDLITRNNTRSNILNITESQARCYQAAIGQATTADSLNAIRQSILVSLNEAYDRKLCFESGAPGCGRFGVDEPDGGSRGADEQARAIDPLLNAYVTCTSKLASIGGTERDVAGYPSLDIVAVKGRQCGAWIDGLNAKYAEYKGIDYNDTTRRNNTRDDLRAKGRSVVACLSDLADIAIQRGNAAEIAMVKGIANSALIDSRVRQGCFADGASGCGRFGWVEADEATKASDEANEVGFPLLRIIANLDAHRPVNVSRTSLAGLSGLSDIHLGRIG